MHLIWSVCVVSFRSDPHRWARYFRVQRMIEQMGRVEREAAEKRQQETETAERPAARRAVTGTSHRPAGRAASVSSALRIVFGGRGSVERLGIDPSPLLSTGRGTELGMKPCRSAGGRLDVCSSGQASKERPPRLLEETGDALSRTHSCDVAQQTAGEPDLKRSPCKSTTMLTLQVSNV